MCVPIPDNSEMQLPIKNLTALAVAVQVAERGSFAGASKALGLSTSAVSKSISRLEAQLGIKLFNRTTRAVSLTTDGHAYIEKLKPLLVEIGGLTQELVDHSENPKGLLRVGAPVSFGRILLAPVVAEFSKQYPEIEIELVLDDRMLDLANEQIDVSIRTGELADSANIVARRFMSDPMIICASNDYLERHGVPTKIADLEAHRLVTFKNNRTGRIDPWVFKDGERFSCSGAIRSNTVDTVVQIIRDGAGLGQVSLYKAKEAIDRGELTEVLKSHRPPSLKYSVLYLNRHLLAPRIRAFIDYLLAQEWPNI